jgi:hypothetical protein
VLGETWRDQYKRLQRSYALLQRVADQNDYDEEIQQPDAARDILYHFCSDVLNLRDWIKHSSGLPSTVTSTVGQLFNPAGHPNVASDALAACADIANGSKHLVLNRSATPGGPAEIVDHTQGARFPMSFPFHFEANHWTIDIGGVEHDAHDLAAQAIADWDVWLTRHGLLPRPA